MNSPEKSKRFLLGPLGMMRSESMKTHIQACVWLFGKAKESIKIVGGELDHKLYEDPRIVSALREAGNRNVSIEIIYGPEMDPVTKELMEPLWREGRVSLFRLKSRPDYHFMVVDDVYLNLEGVHLPFQEERESWIWKTSWLGEKRAEDFLKLKARSEPHSSKEISTSSS